MDHELREFIKNCDNAIMQKDFDTLMHYYTDDDILVVKPGMIARRKEEV
jgi:ketosteroid isomerase-like protein